MLSAIVFMLPLCSPRRGTHMDPVLTPHLVPWPLSFPATSGPESWAVGCKAGVVSPCPREAAAERKKASPRIFLAAQALR